MNARVELKPVEFGTKNLHDLHSLARAIDHTITCYQAIPAYAENKEIRDAYWKRLQENCGEMLGALHG